MAYRVLAFALAIAASLVCGATPSRAAGEPVATAPIPPPPTDRPAIVPLHSPPPTVAAPAKPAPKSAAKAERAAPSHHQPKRAEARHKQPDTAKARKSSKQSPGETGKRAERRKSRTDRPESGATHWERTASRDQLRPPADYRPRRYYYREEVEGPFPPPWHDRRPPFAAMPYPRGPMPPW
jgi:hypothetical protein